MASMTAVEKQIASLEKQISLLTKMVGKQDVREEKSTKSINSVPKAVMPHLKWAKENRDGVKYEGFCRVKRNGGQPYEAYVISYNIDGVDKRIFRAVFETGFQAKKSVSIIKRL